MNARSFLPQRLTLVYFAVMTLLWFPIVADLFDRLPEPLDTIGIVACVLAVLALGGVYSALSALQSPESKENWITLGAIGLKMAILLGLSASLAALAGEGLGLA